MTDKAKGVYYTPSPVVDYIVRTTLSPLLEGKSPMQLAGRTHSWERDYDSHPLTILDPACGTGNFPLGAYQFLLDWCLQWYSEHEPETWSNQPHATICQVEDRLELTIRERQRILCDHIFGVDIDGHALGLAKQSLLRKMHAEMQSASPILENLRCGNSLISSDFQPRCDIHTFDWETEFPSVIAAGGFDVIVGNPPYVNARLVKQEQGETVKQYYREKYRCARGAFDLYVLFIERSHELLREGGRAGLIVPNKIATLDYARPCRELLLTETTIDTITDVSDLKLFNGANVYPYIVTWTKRLAAQEHTVQILKADDLATTGYSHVVRQAAWSAETGIALYNGLDVEARVATRPLDRCGSIHSGTTGFCAEQLAETLREQNRENEDSEFDFVVSGNVDRYSITLGNVRFMKRTFTQPVLAVDTDIISTNKRSLFASPKIVIAGMGRRLEAAFDPGGLALGVQVYAVADLAEDWRYLLGILNSKLMSYLLRTRFQAKRLAGGYLAINKSQLAKLPIRRVDEDDQESVIIRDRIIKLVDRLRPMDAKADREIDRLVFHIYAITEDEIETVQQSPL
ncbi:MAG: N-6 DNA methylase [Planctomycetes bacterium]|nr:N-6 DNA methylase [Planctomycetota bacterium]